MEYSALIDESLGKEQEIFRAIEYVCKRLMISNPLEFNCIIKVTNNYCADYNDIHFQPDGAWPNGTTVPPIFQKEEYKRSVDKNEICAGKSVILINNEKCCDYSLREFTSVIVHELSHCYDYAFKYPEIQERYGIEIEKSKEGTVAHAIGCYYRYHSEARAKYLQEMFIVEHHEQGSYRDVLYNKRNCSVRLDPIKNALDYYHAAFRAGTIRCWEEYFIANPIAVHNDKESKIVEIIQNCFDKQQPQHELFKDMYEAWDWDLMIQKCDRILIDNGGNLNAKVKKCVALSNSEQEL